MTITEAKKYILANWFDGDEDVKSVVYADEEYTAMKIAVELMELAEKVLVVDNTRWRH